MRPTENDKNEENESDRDREKSKDFLQCAKLANDIEQNEHLMFVRQTVESSCKSCPFLIQHHFSFSLFHLFFLLSLNFVDRRTTSAWFTFGRWNDWSIACCNSAHSDFISFSLSQMLFYVLHDFSYNKFVLHSSTS